MTLQVYPTLGNSVGNQRMLLELKCASLIFDFELDDDKASYNSSVKGPTQRSNTAERLQSLSKPDGGFPRKLLEDVRSYRKIIQEDEAHCDSVLLACRLANIGYNVFIRNSLGGGQSYYRNLRHEFLVVIGENDFEGVEFIVEPNFQDHFCISEPTKDYEHVLKSVPEVFVGTSSHLIAIVQLICNEIAASFSQRHITLPPWRRTDSMLTKWLAAKSKDKAVHPVVKAVVPLSGRMSKDNWVPKVLDRQSSLEPASPRKSLLSTKLSSNGSSPVAMRKYQSQFDGEAPIYCVKLGGW